MSSREKEGNLWIQHYNKITGAALKPEKITCELLNRLKSEWKKQMMSKLEYGYDITPFYYNYPKNAYEALSAAYHCKFSTNL